MGVLSIGHLPEVAFYLRDRTPHSAGALFDRAPTSVGVLSETGRLTLQASINRTPASAGVLSIECLQVQAFKQSRSRNPLDRVSAPKRLEGGGLWGGLRHGVML